MADMNEIYTALRAAEKDGRTDDVRKLVAYIESKNGEPQGSPIPERDYLGEMIEKEPWYKKLGLGAIGGFAATGQGARQLAADIGIGEGPTDKEIQDLQEFQKHLRGTLPGFAGEAATYILPGAAITKPVMAIPKVARALAAASRAKNIGIMTGVGATEGAGQGMLTPVNENQSRPSNVIEGMAFGAGAPLVLGGAGTLLGGAYGGAKTLLGGSRADYAKGMLLRQSAGDEADKVADILSSYRQSGLTSGQALAKHSIKTGENITGIPALERQLMQKYAPDTLANIKAKQEAARISTLRGEDVGELVAKRTDATKPMREGAMKQIESINSLDAAIKEAEAQAINPLSAANQVLPQLQKEMSALNASGIEPIKTGAAVKSLLQKANDPEVMANKTVSDAIKMFANQVSQTQGNPRALYELEKQMGDVVGDIINKINPNTTSKAKSVVMAQIKPIITRQLDAASGNAFSAYKKTYSGLSRQIDQAKVMRILQQRLGSPIEGGNERMAAFATAVEKDDAIKTILKKGTGGHYYDSLDELMTPDQMAAIRKVQGSLDVESQAASMAKQGAAKIGDILPGLTSQNTLPSFQATILLTQRLLNAAKVGAGHKTTKELAKVINDPAEIARLMKYANVEEKRLLARHIKLLHAAGSAGAIESRMQ